MADGKKINDSTIPTITDLSGREQLPLNNGGVDAKTDIDNIKDYISDGLDFMDKVPTAEAGDNAIFDANGQVVVGGSGANDLIRISANDTSNDYLNPKIVAGTGITTTILNPGANEQLEISSDGGAGGGHVLEDNQVALTQRDALNIVSNGSESVLEDDAANEATNLLLKLSTLLDVDLLGVQDSDLMQYNSASGKHEPVSVAPFDDLLSVSEAVTAVGLSSLFSKANYSIVGIRIESTTGTGALNIGTTNGGSEIASVADITGLNDVIEINSRYFSDVNDTDIYLTGFTGDFTFYLLTIKGGFSDLPSGGVGSDAYTSLTYGATVAWDCSTGLNKTLTSTGDFILSLTNLTNGMSGDLRLNATAVTTITLPTSLLNGSVTSLAIGVYHLTWVYDGTNLEFNIANYA